MSDLIRSSFRLGRKLAMDVLVHAVLDPCRNRSTLYGEV